MIAYGHERDAGALDHTTLQEFRLLAVRRVREGEKRSVVVKSLGMHRTSIYRWLKAEAESGQGERALLAQPIPGRPPSSPRRSRSRCSAGSTARPAPVRAGRGAVDAPDRGAPHQAEVGPEDERHRGGQDAGPTGSDTTKAPATRLPAKPQGDRTLEARDLACHRCQGAGRTAADVYFWDESGFRAETPCMARHGHAEARPLSSNVPGSASRSRPPRRSAPRAASGMRSTRVHLNAELFIELLKKLTKGRRKPLHLVVDGLPAHKTASVREYVTSTQGKLSLHVLPGYAPDLNPDELVWSHVKRTGVARSPLRAERSWRSASRSNCARCKRIDGLFGHSFALLISAYLWDFCVVKRHLVFARLGERVRKREVDARVRN